MKLLPPGILKDYFYNLKKDITSSAFGRWFIENESKPEFDQELQEIWKESSQVADRKSTRLNSSHTDSSRMPSSA